MKMQELQQKQYQELNENFQKLASSIDKSKFPSQPMPNPNIGTSSNAGQNLKPCQAVMSLRSGKELKRPELPQNEKEDAEDEAPPPPQEEEDLADKRAETEITAEDLIHAPFPSRLQCQSKDKYLTEISSIFNKCQVNIPLLEVIKQVPRYAKFLKELCTQKRTVKVKKKAFLAENVSAIVQNNVRKLKDPGAPIITCTIGTKQIKCLLDLGSSVNIMPCHIVTQMGLGPLMPTTVTLQLADRSIKIPRGQIEDVIVQVNNFYYPVDFIVLDIERSFNSISTPIILGRPFLATCDAQIGCREGNLKISFGDMSLDLNIFNSYKPEKETVDVNLVDSCETEEEDLIDSCVEDYAANHFEPANAYYDNCAPDFGTSEVLHVQDLQEEEMTKRPLAENSKLPLQAKKKKTKHTQKKQFVSFVQGQKVMLISKPRTIDLGPFTVNAQKPDGRVQLKVEGRPQGFTVHANMLEVVQVESLKLGEAIKQAKDPPLGGV